MPRSRRKPPPEARGWRERTRRSSAIGGRTSCGRFARPEIDRSQPEPRYRSTAAIEAEETPRWRWWRATAPREPLPPARPRERRFAAPRHNGVGAIARRPEISSRRPQRRPFRGRREIPLQISLGTKRPFDYDSEGHGTPCPRAVTAMCVRNQAPRRVSARQARVAAPRHAVSIFMMLLACSGCRARSASLEQRAKAALSQTEGSIRLAGLGKPVEVLRDTWGVPHIYAQSAPDLFFAQGFVAAEDRLFQMEMWRRT